VLKSLYRTARAESLPETISLQIGEQRLELHKISSLRYGENPHQSAAHYGPQSLTWIKDGKGGPSWTNLADIDQACKILRFMDQPAALVMKHLNPSGAAQLSAALDLATVYRGARECDSRSAFGGVAVLNRRVDAATAEAILEGFVEVVAAPDFSPRALELLQAKKDLRLAKISAPQELPRFHGDPVIPEVRFLTDGSCLVQDPFLSRVRGAGDLIERPVVEGVQAEHVPDEVEREDLLFAWYVTTGVRSNGIVIAKQGRTLAVGTGQQERVGAVEQAIARAKQRGHDLEGAVLASDGFFPFRDSLDLLAKVGIRAVVQPGGSVRDREVIEAANEHGMAMVFSGERCFGHF
jgi:phosphoribosylaminoimidazolecarboxamide formyltransferase/IMP cyclohydrolase